MTISDTATKFRYQGNGVTDTFAFSGKAFTAADLVVEIITRATDALEETLTITTDYSVTIAGDGTASIVTVSGKIPSATQDIQIRRALAQTQTVVLPTGTKFPAKSVETAIDRAVGLSQDLEESVTRSLKFPVTSSTTVATLPEPTDDATIAFDGTTGAFKVGPTTSAITAAASNATAAAASATAAAASASAASTSATNAAASAASLNIATPTASKHGALLYQNDDDDGYNALTSQGTSGQILTSNGADAAPSWQDAAAGGAWTLLSTTTASTSATVDIASNIDSTYTAYVVIATDIKVATDGADFYFRASEDGGSNYLATNEYDYQVGYSNAGTGTFTESATAAAQGLIITNCGNASASALNFQLFMHAPATAATWTQLSVTGTAINASSRTVEFTSSIAVESTSATNAIRFLASSGNITSGSFKLYGIS